MPPLAAKLRTAALLLTVLCAPAFADDPRPSITVSGRGEHRGAPDLAIVSFAVETTAPEASLAMNENTRKSQELSTAIKGALAGDDRLSTSGYSLEPVYDHHRDRAPDEPPAITGYVARNEVRVETTKTNEVGRLIDLATKAGANRVSGLQFTLEDQAKANSRALEKAAEDAARQAKIIAASLGVGLGAVLSANTSFSTPGPPQPFYRAAMAMEAQTAPPIEAGDVRIEATLHVTYAIE